MPPGQSLLKPGLIWHYTPLGTAGCKTPAFPGASTACLSSFLISKGLFSSSKWEFAAHVWQAALTHCSLVFSTLQARLCPWVPNLLLPEGCPGVLNTSWGVTHSSLPSLCPAQNPQAGLSSPAASLCIHPDFWRLFPSALLLPPC